MAGDRQYNGRRSTPTSCRDAGYYKSRGRARGGSGFSLRPGSHPRRSDPIAAAPPGTTRFWTSALSDVVNNAANVLERKYPYQDRITAAGPRRRRRVPRCLSKDCLPSDRGQRPLPFAEQSFRHRGVECGGEHLGSKAHQLAFVRELTGWPTGFSLPCRTGTSRSSITPRSRSCIIGRAGSNWLCKWLGKADWADERRLILMSWPRLAGLALWGCPGDRLHRLHAGPVQLQSVSVH